MRGKRGRGKIWLLLKLFRGWQKCEFNLIVKSWSDLSLGALLLLWLLGKLNSLRSHFFSSFSNYLISLGCLQISDLGISGAKLKARNFSPGPVRRGHYYKFLLSLLIWSSICIYLSADLEGKGILPCRYLILIISIPEWTRMQGRGLWWAPSTCVKRGHHWARPRLRRTYSWKE